MPSRHFPRDCQAAPEQRRSLEGLMAIALLRNRTQLCRAVRQLSHNLEASRGLAIASTASSEERCGIIALLKAFSISSWAASRPQTSTQRQQPHYFSFWEQRRLAGAAAQPVPADEEITLTENAVEKLQELCQGQAEQCLRLTVEAGGCSGFSYKFDLDASVNEGDRIFEAGGVRLVADSMSYEFVRGSKIDYSQELIKSSFEVVDNPNADKGCGCGTSFSPK